MSNLPKCIDIQIKFTKNGRWYTANLQTESYQVKGKRTEIAYGYHNSCYYFRDMINEAIGYELIDAYPHKSDYVTEQLEAIGYEVTVYSNIHLVANLKR